MSGTVAWQRGWQMPFWVVGMALGSLLLRLERYAAIKPVLATSWTDHNGVAHPFVSYPGEIAQAVASEFGPSPPEGQVWRVPGWSWLERDLPAKRWLADRYPEWLRRTGEPRRSLTEFDMLACVARGFQQGGRQLALWSIHEEEAEGYARRLHADRGLRERVAEAVGTTLELFDEKAPLILGDAQGVGGSTDVANILRTGSFR